jgi:L-cysteine desulfidase
MVARPATRLQGLTLESLRGTTGFPRLRAKAGVVRGLVPFGAGLSAQLATQIGGVWVQVAALNETMLCLQTAVSCDPFSASHCLELATSFCAAWDDLAKLVNHEWKWRLKPKHHMALEMMKCTSAWGSPVLDLRQ